MGTDRSLTVAVAVLTYRRPRNLATLLTILCAVSKPDNCKVVVLVVDNDSLPTARNVFGAYAKSLGEARYIHEPRRGIPIARNRAVDEALRLGADVLIFIDDDECPGPDWLASLIQTYRETGCHLIGGPVRVTDPLPSLTRWQRLLHHSLAARAHQKEQKIAKAAKAGRAVTIVTNNWLGDLRWIADSGLRFDESRPLTGGTDTLFFRAAFAAGARSAWCPDAVVYETIPPVRLTAAYQFHRSRAQSINNYLQCRNRGRWETIALVVARIALGAAALIVPIRGVASLVSGIRSIGWAVGRIDALSGRRIDLYEDPCRPHAASMDRTRRSLS